MNRPSLYLSAGHMFSARLILASTFLTCIGVLHASDTVTANFMKRYCVECHQGVEPSSGISLPDFGEDQSSSSPSPELRELILKQLQTRQMPPPESARPSEAEYERVSVELVENLDKSYFSKPSIPKSEPLRRLTRTEYRNAIRDLFGFTIDEKAWLPADDSSHGFDNITVGELTPTQLQRYVSAAEKVAKLVIGSIGEGAFIETIRIPPMSRRNRMSKDYHSALEAGRSSKSTFRSPAITNSIFD